MKLPFSALFFAPLACIPCVPSFAYEGPPNSYGSLIRIAQEVAAKHLELRAVSPSEGLRRELETQALDQARTWTDTILEGDYWAAGNTTIDRVEGVFAGNTLQAYRITYSESAFETSRCPYWETGLLDGCAPGRIQESSYITLDFSTVVVDESASAEFVAEK